MLILIVRGVLSRRGAQLGTLSVGQGSQSTCSKVCCIGRGAQLGAIGAIGIKPALLIVILMLVLSLLLEVL